MHHMSRNEIFHWSSRWGFEVNHHQNQNIQKLVTISIWLLHTAWVSEISTTPFLVASDAVLMETVVAERESNTLIENVPIQSPFCIQLQLCLVFVFRRLIRYICPAHNPISMVLLFLCHLCPKTGETRDFQSSFHGVNLLWTSPWDVGCHTSIKIHSLFLFRCGNNNLVFFSWRCLHHIQDVWWDGAFCFFGFSHSNRFFLSPSIRGRTFCIRKSSHKAFNFPSLEGCRETTTHSSHDRNAFWAFHHIFLISSCKETFPLSQFSRITCHPISDFLLCSVFCL